MKTVRRLVLLANCSAILFVGKIALLYLPNFEVVTFLLIIFTLTFKFKEALLISTVYTIVEALYWTISEQAYIWTLIVLTTYLFKKVNKENFLLWAIYSGFYGFIFGTLCAIPIYLFLGKTGFFVYLIANIPFDMIHMVGNYFIMLLLGPIVYKNLQKLINGYYSNGGFYENLY